MNSKQLGIFILVGLILGGLAIFVVKKKADDYQVTTSNIGKKLLPDFPVNDIAQLTIKTTEEEVNLTKTNEVWVVKERSNYPANFGTISEFLMNLWDLKILNSQKVEPGQLSRLELNEPDQGSGSGTLVELKDKNGKVLETLIMGKQHMRQGGGDSQFGGGGWPDGRYLMVKNGDSNVVLVNEPFSNIDPSADSWLNKDFFKVSKIQSVEVSHASNEESWSLSRTNETGTATMLFDDPDKELDSSKASRVMSMLSYPSFNDVQPYEGADLAEYGLDKPITAKVRTFEGFDYTFQIGSKEGSDDHFITIRAQADLKTEREPAEGEADEDKERLDKEFHDKLKEQETKLANEKKLEGWIYKVSKWNIEPATFKKSDLLKEKEAEEAEEEGLSGSALDPAGFNPLDSIPAGRPGLNLDPLTPVLDEAVNQAEEIKETLKKAADAVSETAVEAAETVQKTIEPIQEAVPAGDPESQNENDSPEP